MLVVTKRGFAYVLFHRCFYPVCKAKPVLAISKIQASLCRLSIHQQSLLVYMVASHKLLSLFNLVRLQGFISKKACNITRDLSDLLITI